jgi:F-type H+-transporting ATPase subunit c
VKNFAKIVGISFVVLVLTAAPAAAQQPGTSISFSGAIGAGVVAMGAAYGIGKLASSAVESMARQPEVAGKIQTAMIIAAALIEGFTFYALVICQGQNPWGN